MWYCLWTLLWCQIISVTQAKVSPNIIFIIADDLGSSDASFNMKILDPNTPPPIETPHIDFLAHHGIILSSYYTPPLCGPSRSAILTSRYPYRLGNPFPARGHGDLTPNVTMYTKELKSRNYITHLLGKWGIDNGNQIWDVPLGRWVNKSNVMNIGPRARGFDTFIGLYGNAHNHYTKRVLRSIDWHRHNQTGWYDYPDADSEPSVYSTHLLTREAINIIRNYATAKETAKPFFLQLAYSAPHDPLQVPKEYKESSTCTSIPNWRRKAFCGMVRCLDEGIGNITTALKTHNLLEDTIIVFVSDNGGFGYVGGRNYPYRGYKGSLHEGGIHVPAFIHAPKYVNGGGRVFKGLFHAIDWAPTLLSLLDQSQGTSFKHSLGDIDGQDLSLVLSTKEQNLDSTTLRQSIILGSDPFSNGTAYIKGHYKLMLGRAGSDTVGWEPDSYWSLPIARVTWSDQLEEIIINVMDWVSVDLFPFAWSVHIVFAYFRDYFRGTGACTVDHHPDDTTYFRDPAQTFSIVLPSLQWDIPGRVQLYNLKVDPFEENNIANENKILVEEMQKEIIERIKNAPQQMGAMHNMFRIYILMIKIFLGSLATIVGLTIWCCCCRRKRKSPKPTNKPKGE